MRTLKKIITRNIQSHKEVVIDLPRTGIVRFSGNNSNGKSVITKVTAALVDGSIKTPAVRNTLINKDAMAGEVTYIDYDNNMLLAHIQREASATYVEYTPAGKEPIRRYLSEGAWLQLVHNFGFAYNANRDIYLQIVDDDSPLLYFATSPKVNAEVINTAMSDEVAAAAVEQFENFIKDINSNKKSMLDAQLICEQAMSKFETYDTATLSQHVDTMELYLGILENYYIPEIPEIPDMTPAPFYDVHQPQIPDIPNMQDVTFYDIHTPNIPVVPDMTPVAFYTIHTPDITVPDYPTLYDVHCDIPDVYTILVEMEQMRQGVCPTCGRSLVEDESTHTMHI